MKKEKLCPPNTLLPLTSYSFIYIAVKNKHNLVKFMQCIPSQLEPDIRNNHSARTPGSIPLKLLCCSLLKNMCRLQAENERKLPRVSLRVWAVTTLGSALAHRWQWKAQGAFGRPPLQRAQHWGFHENWTVPSSLHLQSLTVWVGEALLQNHPKKGPISGVRLWRQ